MSNSAAIHIPEPLVRTFLREAPRHWRSARGMLLGGMGTLALLAGVYVLLNLSAFMRLHDAGAEAASPLVATVPAPTAAPKANAAQPAATPAPTPSAPATWNIANNVVSYPKLNISAPVTFDAPLDEKTIQADLFNGAVQISGTATPGQHGNVVVFGHSSYYPFIRNDYRDIFAPLLKAAVDDTFEISHNNNIYLYQVTLVRQVEPTDVAVMNADLEEGATLITCSPVGSSRYRYVVYGKQVSPYPNQNATFAQASFSGTVPAGQ